MIVCRNKSSTLIEYIELRVNLNQFEMFVSSLIHEKNIWKLSVIEENSVKRKPCRERK